MLSSRSIDPATLINRSNCTTSSASNKVGQHIPIVFPCHPRTEKRLHALGLHLHTAGHTTPTGIILQPPLGYLDFLHLMSQAKFVLTDSGGVQEETTILGVPCLTLRRTPNGL